MKIVMGLVFDFTMAFLAASFGNLYISKVFNAYFFLASFLLCSVLYHSEEDHLKKTFFSLVTFFCSKFHHETSLLLPAYYNPPFVSMID